MTRVLLAVLLFVLMVPAQALAAEPNVVLVPNGAKCLTTPACSPVANGTVPGLVHVVDIASGTILADVTTACNPVAITTLRPKLGKVYVGSFGQGLGVPCGGITVIDVQTLTVLSIIPVPGESVTALASSPHGDFIFAATRSTLLVIDPVTDTVVNIVSSLCCQPAGLTVSPDGSQVYVASADSFGFGLGAIQVVDVSTLTLTTIFPSDQNVSATNPALGIRKKP